MNLLKAWKKVVLFGLFGAVGCLAGYFAGEPYLLLADAATPAGSGRSPSLISKSKPPEGDPLSDDFRQRLDLAKAKTGDVQISLIWFDQNDLDLHCIDPSGFEIYFKQRESPTRGQLDVDRNASCNNPTVEPVENIYWPENKAPLGEYHVYVNFFQRCPPGARNESAWKLNVLNNGKRKELSGTIVKEPGPAAGPKKHVYEFTVAPSLEVFAPEEFAVPQSASVKVRLPIRRFHVEGPVEVAVENLPEGLVAGKLILPKDQSEGEIEITATDRARRTEKPVTIKFVATGGGLSGSGEAKLAVVRPSMPFSLWEVISIGVWTALLAIGLCLALLAGQNKYLGKSLFAPGRVPLVLMILGAALAGFVSGSIGQTLFFVLFSLGVGKLGLVLGWMLLGALLGAGMSFFVPNLDARKAALAGLGGGLLGALAFLVIGDIREWLGRFGGAALLGFCIGLMVAVVEAAFRRSWLEVRFSEREVITVNLGTEPVQVGSDSRACTVWARGAAPIALRYQIRAGKVYCQDVPTNREALAANGDTRAVGNVTVVVHTGTAPAGAAPPPVPARPALPAQPVPSAASAPPPAPVLPQPALAAPAKTAQPDYDDGLPMPLGPPPPARATAASILDMDDYRAAPRPVPPKPAPPAAAKPVPPAPKPPVPGAAPSAPKLENPASKPKATGSGESPTPTDGCPSCGRKAPGKPGERYCMVCDRTF